MSEVISIPFFGRIPHLGRVIVLGSTITDLVAQAPRLPLPGEVIIGDDFATFLGRKGFNQAVAASRLRSSCSKRVSR